MKKTKNFLSTLMLLMLAFTTFSCSNEDDPEVPQTPAWESVVGEYTGWTNGVCAYFSQATDNEKVTLAKATDGTLTVTVTSNTWGTSTFSGVEASESGSNISLSGTGTATLGMPGSGSASTYDATLSGTISKDKQTANIVVAYPAVMGGTTITFQLGSAPVSQLLAGSYSGWSAGSSAYFSDYGIENSSVKITANEDGTVNVALTSGTWGNTTIENVAATKATDGSYTLEGSGKFSMGMAGGAAKDYDCNVTGTISNDKETYTINFTLPSVMGGLTIVFQNGTAPVAKMVAGSYSGWSAGSSNYFTNYGAENTSVKITANEDGTVNVAYTSETWGNVTIENVTVEQAEDGSFTLAGKGTFTMGMAGSAAKDYDCELTGTISSDKETYTIDFKLPAVMGGLTITFQNGTAPESGE